MKIKYKKNLAQRKRSPKMLYLEAKFTSFDTGKEIKPKQFLFSLNTFAYHSLVPVVSELLNKT